MEKRLSKHKMTIFSKYLGGARPLCPPGYAYGSTQVYGDDEEESTAIEEVKFQIKLFQIILAFLLKTENFPEVCISVGSDHFRNLANYYP